MRNVGAVFETRAAGVHRVVGLPELAHEWQPGCRFAVKTTTDAERTSVTKLRESGLEGVQWIVSDDLHTGDVALPTPGVDRAAVLYRESDVHHSLFLTNRCNSRCLMCSQPPTTHPDDWLVTRALDVVRHVRVPPVRIGLTGGEPLLLGNAVRRLLDDIARRWPDTRVDVLTNGRLLADSTLARQTLDVLNDKTTWLVPLYGHADFLHDFVVQAPGAFDETIAGLLNLRRYEQAVQLRIVLIEPVLRSLQPLAEFIGKNLPFAREVALMACEPTGYALANEDVCKVDLADWAPTLMSACATLRRHRVPYIFMNAPLCALPRALWADAHRSISDWKNVYAAECDRCAVKAACTGLFAWHERGWKPAAIQPVEEIEP